MSVFDNKVFLPLLDSIKNGFSELKNKYAVFTPVVQVIQVQQGIGCSVASAFLNDVARKCGIITECISLSKNCEDSIQGIISKSNVDPNIHGIIVQLSNDMYCDFEPIYDAVLPIKDITGLGSVNVRNIKRKHEDLLLPCTVTAFLEFVKILGLSLHSSNVYLFGKRHFTLPLLQLLLSENATVTTSHEVNDNTLPELSKADIVLSEAGCMDSVKKILKADALLIECYSDICGDSSTIPQSEWQFKYVCPKTFQNVAACIIAKNLLISSKLLLETKWSMKCLPLKIGPPGLSDIAISRSQTLKKISVLAEEIGLLPHEIDFYGDKKAKISLSVLERCKYRTAGKYIVVSGITPTPLGEGKSTTTVGLCQALGAHLKKNVIACLRQPSQGPTFGIKGGAAGGGYSQVVPMEDFNLHLTGDIHAVTAANNLLAAQIDARMFHETTQKDEDLYKRLVKVTKGKKEFSRIQIARLKKLGIHKEDPDSLTKDEISRFVRLNIDPATITWHRVCDTNDRFLRKVLVGLADTEKKMSRETQFDIAVASEIMAIQALTTDMSDMKEKLAKIVVANDMEGNPITSDDLGITGALAVLLKDSIQPNLMQTLEGTPVLVHTGPFANIAHGNSSIIADKIGLKIVGKKGFVVTEAGFGADIGLEKFCDIKCRYSGLTPNAVVIVATLRALKLHGGGPNITSGLSLPTEYTEENIELLEKGFCNLQKHIQIAQTFGLPVVVAVNQFSSDTEAELNLVKKLSEKNGAFRCVICNHFSEGGKGAIELAEAVIAASEASSHFRFLYNLKTPLADKIAIIAKEIYGADGIELTSHAQEMIKLFEKQGFQDLPICMAKTPLSLTDNPAKKGVPVNFTILIKDIKLSAGAGFIYPLLGTISTMPGLPTRPCFYDIDIDAETGTIEGLF